jgi:hypothetical protein
VLFMSGHVDVSPAYCLQVPRLQFSKLSVVYLAWGLGRHEYLQMLAASRTAVAALAAGPCTITGVQSTNSLSEFSRHQGPQPVTICPFQHIEYQERPQVQAKVQADVLKTVKPLLSMLPHISLDLKEAPDVASTTIIADRLGPTTTKLNLGLSTNTTGGPSACP